MKERKLFYKMFALALIGLFVLSACQPAAAPAAQATATTGAMPTSASPATPTTAAAVEPTATTAAAEPTATTAAAEPTATTAAAAEPTATTAAAGGPAMATATPNPSVTGKVEIFSWWVGPGEADGLAAMVEVFKQHYPNIKFVNAAVAGGAGTNAKAVLATRLAADDPPDSWQAHAGQEIIATFVAANQVAPLDDFFNQTGFDKVLPKTLLPLISKDGHPYSVPVNIHRSNVLWYNPKVLTEAGVTANPKTDFKTWDDFFAACDKVKAAGKTCLAFGAPWTAIHLFENVMIGTIGAEKWNGLWTSPPTTDWNGADVQQGHRELRQGACLTPTATPPPCPTGSRPPSWSPTATPPSM